MKVALRDNQDGLLAFGEVDEGDGYDGTPIVEWDGLYFTPSGAVTPEGYAIYVKRTVRPVVAADVWAAARVARAAQHKSDSGEKSDG